MEEAKASVEEVDVAAETAFWLVITDCVAYVVLAAVRD